MHVQRAETGSHSLRRQLRRACCKALQVLHLGGIQQLIFFGPALGAARRPHAKEPAAALHNADLFPVLNSSDRRGLQRQVAADAQRRGAHVRFGDDGSARRAIHARAAHQQRADTNNLRYETPPHT